MRKLFAILSVIAASASSAFAFQPVVTVPVNVTIAQTVFNKVTSSPACPGSAVLACGSMQFDASAYTQARLVVIEGSIASNGTTSLFMRYQPNTAATFKDNTFSDYLPAGSSGDVGVTLGTVAQTIYVGPWTDLAAGTDGDDVWILGAVDTANGNLNPYVGSISLQFR